MYPMLYYIGYGAMGRDYRKVYVTGYQDAISMSGFRNLMLNTPYHLCYGKNGKHKYGLAAYDYTYSVVHYPDWEEVVRASSLFPEIEEKKRSVGEPINLKDYYKDIGYEYKSKKLKGKTMRQWILSELAKNGRTTIGTD